MTQVLITEKFVPDYVEMQKWCEEHIGQRGTYWNRFALVVEFPSRKGYDCTFQFKYKTDAVMFALRWR